MTINYEKLRGGYYTPKIIADFLVSWAANNVGDILEPSAGDGVFVDAVLNNDKFNSITAIELDPKEASKIRKKIPKKKNIKVIQGDFFQTARKLLAKKTQFQTVLGNPPFIRYQNFVEEYRETAFELMNEFNLKPNRLTNIWVPFLVVASRLLKKEGRLAMVIPAELFQVNYAAETRKFITDEFSRVAIITFKKLLFKGTQQEVVLLLAEKDGHKASIIQTLELNDENQLKGLSLDNNPDIESKEMLHTKDKWTYYFLNKREINFLNKLRKKIDFPIASNVIDVDVGVVTGCNDFFVLKPHEVANQAINDSIIKIVTRSAHLKGITFRNKDWKQNIEKDVPSFMFYPPNVEHKHLSSSEKKYIKLGEKGEFHKGYKCRIRKRWYIVPSIWIPDAFMLRQVHEFPKLICNQVSATCTDTIHRLKISKKYDKKRVCAAFLNSLTFAFSELIGRSYGGGVMTFEPSECERLPFPLKNYEDIPVARIDELIRKGEIEKILDINDKILLEDGLGIARRDIIKLRNIWIKLKERRINRK